MRERSVRVAERNGWVVERIQGLKGEHPFWGYRRVWASLRYGMGLVVNKKRVYRLMQEHGLVVKAETRLRATRVSGRSKPRPERPGEWWGIDMTKVLVGTEGWVYVVLVEDWYTKQIVGHTVSRRCRSTEWLEALDRGVNRQFPWGVRGAGLSLMSDNGSQPTSERFMRACGTLGIRQGFTSYNNPKGNADTERLIRTVKEELIWLQEWRSVRELAASLAAWVERYNSSYLHSTLGYRTPNACEATYHETHSTLLGVA